MRVQTRQLAAGLQQVPAYAGHYAAQIEELLLQKTARPEDGEKPAKLVAVFKVDSGAADQIATKLTGIVQGAVIHDAAGRKAPLQRAMPPDRPPMAAENGS